jgi:hypothetical protein
MLVREHLAGAAETVDHLIDVTLLHGSVVGGEAWTV